MKQRHEIDDLIEEVSDDDDAIKGRLKEIAKVGKQNYYYRKWTGLTDKIDRNVMLGQIMSPDVQKEGFSNSLNSTPLLLDEKDSKDSNERSYEHKKSANRLADNNSTPLRNKEKKSGYNFNFTLKTVQIIP